MRDRFTLTKLGCAMDYVVRIKTAHSTYTHDAPLVTPLHLTRGRLVGGWVHFPPGPAGLLHLRVTRGIHQILPFNNGQDYALDDAVAPLLVNHLLDQPPFTLNIQTWNESTTIDHTLSVCLFLEPFIDLERKRSWLERLLTRQQ